MWNPEPSPNWSSKTDAWKKTSIGWMIPIGFRLERFEGHSKVILSLSGTYSHSVSRRAELLLALEARLRREFSPSIEVFLQPKQDASKLRKRLRGVEVGAGDRRLE